MIQKIMDLRNESSLFRKAPDAYGKMIQKQMDKEGMGTVYIDAQAAAEDSTTHEVLNEIVEKGIVSAKELDESIKTGKPLTIESGKYMQLASEETPKILSNYTTMDKGERTIHDLNEIRNREKELRDLIHSTKAEREQRAGKKIMDANFPANGTEFDKEDRATFASLIPGGLENIKDNAKEALKEAMENWMNMLPDVKEHMEYIRQKQNGKGQGEVSVIYRENDSQGAQWESVRVSSNDAWYSAAFKEKGAMPGQRDIIDYDHEQYLKELEASVKPGDTEGEMLIQELKDAKKKVESLERVNHTISKLDKEDLTAQVLLDTDTYEKVYKPYLNQIQLAAKGTKAEAAARDSALILSKIAENMNKNYGIPLELAMAKIMKGQKTNGQYYQRLLEGDKIDSSQIPAVATVTGDELGDIKDISALQKAGKEYYRNHLQGKRVNNELLGEIRFEENKEQSDVVFGSNGRKKMGNTLANPEKALSIPYLPSLIENAEYISVGKTQKRNHPGWRFYYLHSGISFEKSKRIAIITVVDKGNGNIQYYNHNLFSLDTYKQIEDASNEALPRRITNPPKAPLEASSIGIIYQPEAIYKRTKKEESFKQMAGKHANTAPERKLQTAASMEESGKSSEEIWKTTGWMRGPDHKWRFEIPDNLDKIDLNTAKDGKDYSLGEIYNNPALYEAYPELKGIQIRLEKINSTKGKQVRNAAGYVDEDGNIIIDKDLPVYKMKEVLVHEIQHIIQYKEGFSTGGNIYSAKEQIQDTIDKLQLDLQDIELKDPKAKAYMDKAEEIIGSFNTFDFNRAKQLNDERKALLETMSVEERENSLPSKETWNF